MRAGLPVRITMDAYPGRSFPGHVTCVGSVVSEAQQQNRTFDIEVEFDDAAFARTLLPGTSADVEIILRARDGVLRGADVRDPPGRPRARRARRHARLGAGPHRARQLGVHGGRRRVSRRRRVVISLDRAEVREGARVRVDARRHAQ